MDLRTVVIVVAFSLVSADDHLPGQEETTNTNTRSPMITNNNTTPCSCTNATPAAPTSSSSSFALILGVLTVTWTDTCEGIVNLVPYLTFNRSSLPVCHSEENQVNDILLNVCKNKRGCKDDPRWQSTKEDNGYMITEKGASETPSCQILRVKCTVEKLPDFEGQLKACKVVISLLSIILLVLILIRFTRPTVTALQKRLSDRRQHHWVGPTQSHSVSYHRGKSAVRNDDEEKRSSYPALERLTIGDNSPSCNRNFYNF